jgi:AcrR family transcriptional regulator
MAPRLIDRSSIVSAARKILTEQGLPAVSLRNVAMALGVKAPSLYRHVPSKGVLLGLISEQIFRECLMQVPECPDWRDWLRSLGIVLWRTQRHVRDIRRLIIESSMPLEVLGEFSSYMSQKLVDGGLDAAVAFDAQRSVTTLATGWTMIPTDPHLIDIPVEPSFLRSLNALIRGWEVGEGLAT